MNAYLIKNADVYAPQHLGVMDLLVINEKIFSMGRDLQTTLPGLQTVDAAGQVVMPGVVDQHIHVTGGGGEGGPVTRCPEMNLSALIDAGVTSVVGVCGTDSESRSLENLLAKVRALRQEGVSAWMWTSNYAMPPSTVTGTVRRDLYVIPEVIGVKVALGDHRSSFPTQQDVMHLLSDIRVGGMIAGKVGFLHIHLGDLGDESFDILDACVKRGMPIRHIRPTHCARKEVTWNRAKAFALRGGVIDLTAGPCIFESTAEAVIDALNSGVSASNITISTDAHGSMPRFNEAGEMVGLTVCPVDAAWPEFQRLVELLGYEKAIGFVSTNCAKHLNLPGKGVLEAGADADLLILDRDCRIDTMMARGRLMMHHGEHLAKGTFE